ncbi:MAG TPA: hypothetical protein VIV57_01475 [Anaeromyxobacter sp.]
MDDVAYIVSETNGMRTYRCKACGRKLTYLVENVEPALVRTFDRVARELTELHCLRECGPAGRPAG